MLYYVINVYLLILFYGFAHKIYSQLTLLMLKQNEL